jgi:hypothetical protein
LQERGQPTGIPGVCCDELWQAFREDATRAGWITAEEFPRGELNADGEQTPGKVRQLALIAAMH